MEETTDRNHISLYNGAPTEMDVPAEEVQSARAPGVIQPLHPGWLIPLSVLAGLAACGPLAGATLIRCGYRKLGWLLGLVSMPLGLLIFASAILWSIEWYWIALSLTSVHIFIGIGLFFLLWRPYRRFRESRPAPPPQRGSYREVIAGMVGGAIIGSLLAVTGTIVYSLFADWLFSTVMPVAFNDEYASIRLFCGAFCLTLSGVFAGGCIGRFRPRITPLQLILCGLGLLWVHSTWLLALECTISIPGFKAGPATGEGWSALSAPFTVFDFLIGFWWSAFLLFFIIQPPGKLRKLGRAAAAAGINVAAAVTLSITFGYPADMFLALGKHFERAALTSNALWCYEQGLKKEPKDQVASYLQYRAALLNHKLGRHEKARQGLNRVVTKYTFNLELVRKSNRFIDTLERKAVRRRIVLPGVETPTEYKGGYCVPNSLALVMRYWGSDVTARGIGRTITGLGSGTSIVDQRWFASQMGLRHDFLPMASVSDIKRCIDSGFPVLVYVPAHIFVIVGYDDALETFVTYDVATSDVWVEYIRKDFIKAWKRQATTLVLVYPPEKEASIPEDIRNRLIRLSDNYLHFQLHFFDAPTGSVSVPHLLKAAGATGEFFFPVTILYSNFPGLREAISEKYDMELVIDSIRTYFQDDFDEGVHSAGQYHNESWPWPDWALRASIVFLTGQERFELVEDLVTHINEEGALSDDLLAHIGVIDLARGNLGRGLDRLASEDGSDKALYAGLTKLRMGNEQGGVRELAKTVKYYV